jgi:DNA polymerase-4
MAPRVILHVDMDAFYASIEQRDNPSLRGKAVVVGGGSNRGVVAAASYESRAFGVRSAMPMAEARRRCPDLVRVAPRMAHYQDVSREIFAVFKEFTPVVEGLSLDEAFLDVTSSRRLFGSGRRIALAVKDRIRERTGLTASVGVATNKLVAKIASDLDKPDGLVVVMADQVHDVLDPLPVSVIPGIGRRTLARLDAIGIRTIAELRRAPDRRLEPVFGRFTGKAREHASGIDERPVVTSRREKSISNEQTYDVDLCDRRDMERELLRLTERTAGRLRKAALFAGTVQIKIRQSDFRTFTRQQQLKPPGNGTDQIYALARDLLAAWLSGNPDSRIRLLGVGCSSLAPAEQPDLFGDGDSGQASDFDRAIDEIRDRFGSDSVARARTLHRP